MISEFMTQEHRRCDEVFAQAEEAASTQSVEENRARFADFHREMERHFAQEESILFPAFEQATGMSGGPTQVMRLEHQQMRALFAEMAASIEAGDLDNYLGLSETLLVLMQQHNMKEEQILYPMSDQHLAAGGEELLSRIQAVEPPAEV